MDSQINGANTLNIGTQNYQSGKNQTRQSEENGLAKINAGKLSQSLSDLYADIMSYYIRNTNSLSPNEKWDFQRLDNVANGKDLKEWAKFVVPNFDLPDDNALQFANIIRKTDIATLDAAVTEFQSNQRVRNEKLDGLEQAKKQILESNENAIILFKNKDNTFTATKDDALKISDFMGWKTRLDNNENPIININKEGMVLLRHNDLPVVATDPQMNISFFVDEKSEIEKDNRLTMTMGYLSVLSKGNTVRFDTYGSVFGNEIAIQLKNGLFSSLSIDKEEGVLATPILMFDSTDGRLDSHMRSMEPDNKVKLQTFFSENNIRLVETTRSYENIRKMLDQNMMQLIKQQDKIAAKNPNTIILIKQHGFIEAFSDSAIKAAETLGLNLYNRTDHTGKTTIPFTHMTVEDFKKLSDSNNNVYLARPAAMEKIVDTNLTKIKPGSLHFSAPVKQEPAQEQEQEKVRSFKR